MITSQIRAGKLRVLAVSTEDRWPLAPEVKTFRELGHDELTHAGLLGFGGRKGTSAARRNRIAADTLAIANDPKMAARLREMGVAIALLALSFAPAIASTRTADPHL